MGELADVYDIHKPHDYKLHLCLLCLLLLFVSHELSSGTVWFCWYNHILKVNELKNKNKKASWSKGTKNLTTVRKIGIQIVYLFMF